jgi:hypothetical protein
MTIKIKFSDFDHVMSSYRLRKLEHYLQVTEKYLDKAKTDFDSWAAEQMKGLTREQYDEFQDFHQDEYWRYEEEFPRILRNSFLVSACSLFEHEIDILCEKLKKRESIPIGWKELRGDALERFKIYLKLAKIDWDFKSSDWQEINNYYLIRNCIVHGNGLIKGFRDEKALRNLNDKKKIISEDTIEEEIALKATFCQEIISTMHNIFDSIYKTILETKKSKSIS